MATSSDVKLALVNMAQEIINIRQSLVNRKAGFATDRNDLTALTTKHAAAIAEITAFVPTGATETLQKDEFAKLKIEFEALRDDATLAVTDLENRTEF